MTLSMACPACGGQIDYTAEQAGETQPCPQCFREVEMARPRRGPALPPRSTPPALLPKSAVPASYLESLRARTNYPQLRQVLGFLHAVMQFVIILLAGGMLAGSIVMLIHGKSGEAGGMVAVGAFSVVGGFVAWVLEKASYQASLLLVDIADTLLDRPRS